MSRKPELGFEPGQSDSKAHDLSTITSYLYFILIWWQGYGTHDSFEPDPARDCGRWGGTSVSKGVLSKAVLCSWERSGLGIRRHVH